MDRTVLDPLINKGEVCDEKKADNNDGDKVLLLYCDYVSRGIYKAGYCVRC